MAQRQDTAPFGANCVGMGTCGRRQLALAAVTLLSASLLCALPAAAAETYTVYHVPTVGGATIRVEVIRDTTQEKVPVILTMSPYNGDYGLLNGTEPARDGVAARYVPRGYARATADLLGTRGSTGCWDYGGRNEQQAGVDTVNFLASQPWSTGKVAMMGASYDGTTANMVAARGADVPGLAAIVPIVAISHWYGYGYTQGMRFTAQSASNGRLNEQGIDTPLVFDFRSGRTIAPDPTGANFVGNVSARAGECGAVEHTQRGYDESPDYDAFWKERDYLKDAANFRVPVLVGGGWRDFNVKPDQSIDLFDALPVDDPATSEREGVPFKILAMGQNPHGDPAIGQWQTLLDRFLDHTLKGAVNNIQNGPSVYSASRVGTVALTRIGQSWPPSGTAEVTLHLEHSGADGTLAPAPTTGTPTTFTDMAVGDDFRALQDLSAEHDWLWYVSKPLARDMRLAGEAVLDATVSVNRDRGALTPVLVEIPSGAAAPRWETFGALNLQYREGIDIAKPVPANQPVRARVAFKPQDTTFKAGSRIGVVMLASNVGWVRPDLPGQATTVHHGAGGLGSVLRLPIVDPPSDASALFAE